MSDQVQLPRMLDRLLDRLDDIERTSDWEYRFVANLVERFETGRQTRLSDAQFKKLVQVSQRYTSP